MRYEVMRDRTRFDLRLVDTTSFIVDPPRFLRCNDHCITTDTSINIESLMTLHCLSRVTKNHHRCYAGVFLLQVYEVEVTSTMA